MKRSFEIWLETLKNHVGKMESYESLPNETMKFVFENATAHLVLGWAIIQEEKVVLKLQTSTPYGKLVNQDEVNKQAAERIAEAEKKVPWWQTDDRFALFVGYVANLLQMSTKAPYETIFDKLAVSLDGTTLARKIWKKVTAKGHDAKCFATAVALYIGSDIKNVAAGVTPSQNLSILLGHVEKKLRDVGFEVGLLYDLTTEKNPKKVKKISKKPPTSK